MPLKKRTQTPPQYSNYRLYKDFLRVEFDHCCVYCNITEPEVGGCKSFHIDHYEPKSESPQRSNDYLNLFYSCRDCNEYKGSFWPSLIQRVNGEYILNPCDHDLDEHCDRSSITWKAKSKAGSWNLDKLRLNSPIKIQKREMRACVLKWIGELELQEKEFTNLLSQPKNRKKKEEIAKNIQDIQERIGTLKRMISGPLD